MIAGSRYQSLNQCSGLTKAEFQRRREAWKKSESRWCILGIVVFFTLVGAFLWLCFTLDTKNQAGWVNAVLCLLLAGIVGGNLVFLTWVLKSKTRHWRFGLLCVGCETGFHAMFGDFVMETGRCPNCGAVIVEEIVKENAAIADDG